MNRIKLLIITCLSFWLSNTFLTASETELPTRSNVLSVAQKVNDYWIVNHTIPGNNEWTRATYFIGNLELYKVSGRQRYLDYAVNWANSNQWLVNGGPVTSNADNHACGQVYIDLFLMDEVKDSTKIGAIRDAIDYRIENNPLSSDWWWIDAMFMAMPTITRLGVVYNDSKYFEKLYSLFKNTRDTLIVNSGWSISSSITYAPGPIVTCPTCGNDSDGLYNKADGLWWRDWRYQPGVPPQNNKPKQTPNGKNIYWSRGNGWVFAAMARTLEALPADNLHRQEYVQVFTEMALALKNCQRDDGFWNMSLGDTEHYPAPETSGTAFFTYGMAWGINHNLLDSATYYPVAAKAWNGLSTIAIESDGNIKNLQGVGETPTSPTGFSPTSIDFGVGAVLLASAEVSKLAFDDGLPVDSFIQNKDTLIDRADWAIITSSEGVYDTSVGGDNPDYILDDDERTAFLFVKPGKTYGGVTVDSGVNPWFAIDMKKNYDMTHIRYRHRDYNNSTSYLRAYEGSFYGKNTETETYTPIIENFNISVADADVRVNLPEKVSYRYVKFVFEDWNILGGNTIQVSEFYLGNDQTTNVKPVETKNLWVDIYPNPAKAGQPFYIRLNTGFSDSEVIIYTMMGVKIGESKRKTDRFEQLIERGGVYLVVVKSGTERYVNKIVVND
ncbi:MAG: glycoside hydrolase family 88 protein [Paludibacteraceae bacterium]